MDLLVAAPGSHPVRAKLSSNWARSVLWSPWMVTLLPLLDLKWGPVAWKGQALGCGTPFVLFFVCSFSNIVQVINTYVYRV